MSSYLTMMFLTLDQENALKHLFHCKGWDYCKIDLSFTTDLVGPTLGSSELFSKKTGLENNEDYGQVNTCDKNTRDDQCREDENCVKNTTERAGENNEGSTISSFEEVTNQEKVSNWNNEPNDSKSMCYLCPKCGKTFQTSRNLNTHLKVHEMVTSGSKRQFVCTARNCGKSFSRRSHWLFHMNIHEQKRPFMCEYCGISYPSQYSHKRHVKVNHTGDGGRCPLCGKAFQEKEKLLAHKALCYTQCSHRCKHCGAVFKWKARLRRHLQKHEGSGTFTFDNRYDKNYLDYSSDRQEEQNRSEGYFCKGCNKTFCWKQSFNRHKKKHCKSSTGEIIQEEVDKQRESSSGELIGEQVGTHRGTSVGELAEEREEKCTETSTGESVMEQEGKLEKKRNEGYSCKNCNKTFLWKQSFNRHRKKHCNKSSTAEMTREQVGIHGECSTGELTEEQVDGERQDFVIYYIPDSEKTVSNTALVKLVS